MREMDTYRTIKDLSIGEYKEKGSRFIGYAQMITSREEFVAFLDRVKKEHHKARHHCWAYKCGILELEERNSDDGEPSGSAGKPILNQILSANLHQVGVVVVRYFGGTKLGVSGLIRSYKSAAKDAIELATIDDRKILNYYRIDFQYQLMNEVMQVANLDEVQHLHKELNDQPYIEIGLLPSETESAHEKMTKILNQKSLDYQGDLPSKGDYFSIEYLSKK